jgi:uncharacterized repeat protein (TIGR01451 family)
LIAGLLFLPAISANAAAFVVINIDDGGPGSLRQAILDANANRGADTITFAIPSSGAQTISPASPLPAITEQVSLDATTQSGSSCDPFPATLQVRLEGTGAGPDTSGLTVAGGTGTVIKGFFFRRFNGDGISVSAPASGTTITCNAIGTSPDGSATVGNVGAGIAVRSTDPAATSPTVVSDNIIMNNGGAGVLVDPGARLVSIRNNRINVNGGVGIDLVAVGGSSNGDGATPNGGGTNGGNDLQPTPGMTSAASNGSGTTVSGSLTVPIAGDGEFVVDFFTVSRCDTGGFGEGARPIGSIALPASSQPGVVPFVASSLMNANVGTFVTATATGGSGTGNTSEFSACMQVVEDTGNTSADLSITGLAVPEPASALGTITYTFTVQDGGPDPAENTRFESEFLAGLNLASMSTDNGGACVGDVFTVTCDLGTIEPGAANAVHVTIGLVAQQIGADMQFDHRASIEASTPDPDTSNNEVTVTSTVLARRSDLSIQKHGPQEVASGDRFSYTIDVAHAGPGPADHVTVTDVLPAGVSFVDATPNACSDDAGTLTCGLGSLAAGASTSIELHVAADVPPGAPVVVVNTASVASDRADLDPSNDVSQAVSTTVVPATVAAPDVELTSVVNVPNPVTGGYDLGSTATVTNLGPGDAAGVTLTEILSPGETFVAGGSDPSCTAGVAVVTCAIGSVSDGHAASVLIITKTPQVGADTTIHDVFTVSAAQDVTPGNGTLDVATAVRAPRADFVAGYVPPSGSTTWLSDATQWSHGNPVATAADPTVALVGIPGGGHGGPVVVQERGCVAPFACMTLRRMFGRFFLTPGAFGNLVHVSVPNGYGAANPITGVFLDNWTVLGSGWDPFVVTYQADTSPTPKALSSCGGWRHTGPPCVSSIDRSFAWWNAPSFADLRTVVRFTSSGTFGRGR